MKSHTMTRTALLSLALTVSAAPGLAQFPPAGGYQSGSTPTNTIPWQPGITSTERIVFGNIAGDLLPGALALVDGKAIGIFDPEIHKSAFLVETGVNDLDVVAAVGDGPAGMALARSDGVWLYEWDTVPNAPVTFVKTLLAAGSFANLDLLRAGAVDGAGRQDLIGASGATVRLLLDSGSGWADAGSFTAGGTVREIDLIDWDSNSATRAHIAALIDTSAGKTNVQIWEPNGSTPPVYSLDETFVGYAAGGYLAAIPPTTGDPSARLAWSANVNGIGSLLLVLSPGGSRVNCGTLPPSPDSLTSAIYTNQSGLSRVDLLTTSTADTNARLYEHRNATPPYSLVNPLIWTAGSTVLPGDGTPAFGDVTRDRVPDALIARGLHDELYFFAGAEPNLLFFSGEAAWSAPTLYVDSEGFGVTVQKPSGAENYSHWQLLLWKSENGTALNQETVANYKYAIQTGTQQHLYTDLDLGETETVCLMGFDEAYFLTVRLILLNGDTIVSATSGIHSGFAQDDAMAAAMNPNGLTQQYFAIADGTCGQPPGTAGFVPLPSLPPIVNNLPPQITSLVPGPPVP